MCAYEISILQAPGSRAEDISLPPIGDGFLTNLGYSREADGAEVRGRRQIFVTSRLEEKPVQRRVS